MKRTLALTVVTALCAVSPFAAGAAISSLQQPDAPVTSYDGAQAEFVLRDYEGYVSVFAPGGDRMFVVSISVINRATFIVKLIVTCHIKSDRSP